MSWLKTRAEEAAQLCASQDYDHYPTVEEMAPHIEKAMVEFAGRALRKSYVVHVFGLTMAEAIPLAIKAAEEDDAARAVNG